ncbi:fructose-bisphosphate aldolase class I [Candidatus Saccharibacteria bacterium]|nr:fructose-bisphosphate aldolase class I [Candidatus Saccharibacteria bacterium]
MNVLVVGNVLKDVYLNLDPRTETFEADKYNTKWLDIGFNTSEHHFFNRNASLGGAAISLEVLQKMGLSATISDSDLQLTNDGFTSSSPAGTYRYILIADDQVSYFAPTNYNFTTFISPTRPIDYLYIDRSAELNSATTAKITAFLDTSPNTKLVLYARTLDNSNFTKLIPRADLIFLENNEKIDNVNPAKLIHISEHKLSYLDITEKISIDRIDILTHLSAYSIAAATVLGSFILGNSVEDGFTLARINIENSRLNSVLPLDEMIDIAEHTNPSDNLELIAANLVLKPKGILAADESGGSIKKKFAQLNIPDTYDNRRNYRNLFFTTKDLEKYVNGVILFDETARQLADNSQNYVDFLTTRQIIPGIKVDQGLKKLDHSLETYTAGLDDLDDRLKEYYLMGLRFAKWRAAFEIRLSTSGNLLTPTTYAIDENCRILAEYAKKCQSAGLVPIVEPEVVYDGYYSIDQNAEITGQILDRLFTELNNFGVNLRACILKVNMVLAGKNYETPSTPAEVGQKTAEVLKNHVPANLAGVVFLSGGQTVEQATDNLAAIIKNGPFPWPVTFSFARALQDPALYAWAGNNENADHARQAFLDRLIANVNTIKNSPS